VPLKGQNRNAEVSSVLANHTLQDLKIKMWIKYWLYVLSLTLHSNLIYGGDQLIKFLGRGGLHENKT